MIGQIWEVRRWWRRRWKLRLERSCAMGFVIWDLRSVILCLYVCIYQDFELDHIHRCAV